MNVSFCRVVSGAFLILYIIALGSFLIESYRPLGLNSDPTLTAMITPLGWPWNLVIDLFPASISQFLSLVAPLINFALFRSLCAVLGK